MIRARNVVLLALLCLAAAGARAQEWRGSASISVEVKGKPMGAVSDSLVILRYQQMEPPAGPRPVVTDAAGRAVVANLADGLWEVEVSHDEFLSFVALVMLESGRKPQVQASFLQASGSSLTPIRVKFADGKGKTPSASVPLPPEAAERLAQRRPLAPQRPPAATAPAESTPSRRPARAPEPVMPEPELRPLPEAARPTPPPTTPPPTAPAPSEPEPAPATAPAPPQPDAAAPAAPPAPSPTPEPELPEPQKDEPAPPPPTPDPPPPAEPEPATPEPAAPEPVVQAEPEAAAPAAEPEPPAAPASPPEPTPTPEPAAPPAPAPVPKPEASPQPPTPEPDTPSAAEPEPAAPEAALPEPAAPQPVDDEPAPTVAEPESTLEPTPVEAEPAAPRPATVLPPPGRLGPTLRAYRDRTCVECRPGEFAISTETVVGPSSGPCGDTLDESGRELAALLGGSVTLELKELAAPAAEAVGEMAASDPTARVAELLGDDADACRLVAVVIPKAGRFRGLRMEAADATGVGDCQADRPCPVDRAYWVGQPRVAREPSANVIWGIFVNEAPDRARRARLTVYFAAPSRAWDPPK